MLVVLLPVWIDYLPVNILLNKLAPNVNKAAITLIYIIMVYIFICILNYTFDIQTALFIYQFIY